MFFAYASGSENCANNRTPFSLQVGTRCEAKDEQFVGRDLQKGVRTRDFRGPDPFLKVLPVPERPPVVAVGVFAVPPVAVLPFQLHGPPAWRNAGEGVERSDEWPRASRIGFRVGYA